MEGSHRSFDQVKAILGKLDRSIDEARSRRLGVPSREERIAPRPQSHGPSPLDQEVGVARQPASETQDASDPAPAAPTAPRYPSPNRPRPSFGRARPLNASEAPAAQPARSETRTEARTGETNPLGRWIGPGEMIG